MPTLKCSTTTLSMALILGGLAAPVSAQSELYSRLTTFSHSEPVTVKGAFNDLDSDFTRGDLAFTHNELELGWRGERWRFSWFARYDYLLEFHPDTAELIYLENNDQAVELDRQYQLDMEVKRARSVGLRGGYRWPLHDNLDLSLAVSLLRATDLQQGHLNGQISTLNDGTYSGDFALDYVYDEDSLLDRQVAAPTGLGVTADLALQWRLNPQWTLESTVRDLYSHIRWEDAPFTRATVTSSTVTLDANGFLDTQPVLSGVEGFRTHHQRLPIRSDSWLSWQSGDRPVLSVGVYQYDDWWFPRLRIQSTHGGFNWHLMWDTKAEAVGLGVANNWVQLSLISDELEFHQAHTFGLQLGVAVPL